MVETLLPVALFAFTMSGTPGPNNVMLTASGANFGFRRTVPHILGVSIGFPIMIIAVGLGLGGLFREVPMVHDILAVVGSAWLIYLAWRIATTLPAAKQPAPKDDGTGDDALRAEGTGQDGTGGTGHRPSPRPMRFAEAAAFQWANPKAWVITFGVVAAYTTGTGSALGEAMLIGAIFLPITLMTTSVWTAFGTAIGRVLGDRPAAHCWFNRGMAALLVASLVPVLTEIGT